MWPDGKFWKEDPRPKHAKGRARQTIQYSGMWAGSGGGESCFPNDAIVANRIGHGVAGAPKSS